MKMCAKRYGGTLTCRVENRVGNVGHLGARWARVGGHGLQHVSRDDDGLAGHFALGDDHVLHQTEEEEGWCQ